MIRFAALLALAAGTFARADEGMWLLNQPPAALKSTYNFDPSKDFLLRMQRSAVRFQTGGSGSVVSSDGLVMTNHHVGADMLYKLSTKDRNLMETGFYAKTRDAELKCPDLELNILWDIHDVTDKVAAAVKDGMSPAEAGQARRAAIADLEKSAGESSHMKPQVVTLFGGARYHLYLYKAFTDVRLVFAPEEAIAFFGGDADNFEFPRFNLDCCFFRIYENDKPWNPEHRLAWSKSGAAENDLIFVFGHPGRTERLNTVAHLAIARDNELPRRLGEYWRTEIKDQTFAGRSAEYARIVRDQLFGVANSRKAVTGQLEGLQNPAVMAAKKAAEAKLRDAVNNNPELREKYAAAWDQVAALKAADLLVAERRTLLGKVLTSSTLIFRAATLTQLAAELPKPSNQRLREYGDAQLPSLYLRLYSPEPVYDALEIHDLEQALARAAERLGAEDPTVAALLAGRSPRARAEELIRASTLRDPAICKALAEGGDKALAASSDPTLKFAAALDPEIRAMRKHFEDTIESPLRDAYAKIAAAKFAVEGDTVYPDATFTLRLSYGAVKGYTYAGESVPAFTTLGGTYARADERKGQEGFTLPKSWLDKKPALKLDTPFNFICTADIIGGNSGSPVVNKTGEVVGLIFDGNIHSLVGNFAFSAEAGRAVAVDSRGILESLSKVYNADELVAELTR